MRGAVRPNCHTFTLSHSEPGRAPTGSMPAAARPHCILCARDLRIMIVSERITLSKFPYPVANCWFALGETFITRRRGSSPRASSPMNLPDAVDGTADAQTGGMLGEYEHFWGGENPRSQFLVAFCSMYSRTLSVENFCQAWTLVLRHRHLRLCCLALWGLGVSSTCR